MPHESSQSGVSRRALARVGLVLGAAGTAGAAAAVMPSREDPSASAAARWADHDIRRFGAVSGQDCTRAFEAAARTGAIYVPKGVWTYRGAGLDWSQCQTIQGVGRGLAFINLGSGTYLFAGKSRTTRFTASDFSVEGGAGAMNLTNTGPDVGSNGMITWERVDFHNYTRTAVSHRFIDGPNWTFRDCSFSAASDSGTIGIALHGDVADSLIDHCTFGRDQCHIKIDSVNGGADMVISNCDFVRSDAGGSHRRVDVWIVPAPSPTAPGNGAPTIRSCKFGPENRSAMDRAILLADSTGGALWSEPVTKQHSTGEVRGLRILDCLYGANQPTPFATVTVSALTVMTLDSLTLNGELPPYLVEFTAPSRLASAIRQSYGTVTGLVNKDAGITGLVKLQNGGYPMAVTTLDPRRSLEGVPEVNPNASPSTPGVTMLSSADATAQLKAGDANQLAAAGAKEVRVSGSAHAGQFAFYAYLPVAAARPGSWVHVDFEVALPTGASAVLDVALRGDAASATSKVAVSSAAWTPKRVRFLAGGGASQLTLSSSSGGVALQLRKLTVYEERLA